MVGPAPSSLLLEPSAPSWAKRLVLRLADYFLGLYPSAPVRLWSAKFAELPPAADWRAGLVWVPDKGKVAVSDGVTWLSVGGGPL